MNEGSSAVVRFDFKIEDSMSAQEAGLEYVRHRRMPVFTYGVIKGVCTCHKGAGCGKNAGKHPIRNNWPKAAENEQEVRDEYARIRAKAVNVGLILGEQPGGEYLAAIDIDDFDRFVQLEKELGPLPQDTATCHSGRGPRLFYRIPEIIPKARLRNRAGLLGLPGVDAKVGGGQVVVAPSVHSTGKIYTWTRYGEVLTLPVSWADALLEEIAPPKFIHEYTPETFSQDEKAKKKAHAYLQKAVTEEAARLAHMPEGMRNTYLHRKAVRLLALANGSYSIGKWEYVLRQLENAAIHAGLARTEVRRTLASAEKYVIANQIVSGPRPIPVYDGKPADAPDEPPPAEEEVGEPIIEMVQDKGQNAAIAENVARLLAQHPDWNGGPGLDAYSDRIYWPSPRPYIVSTGVGGYTKTDRAAVQGWCVQHGVRAGADTVEEGIRVAAKRRIFDSLITWLNSLPPWDGVPRLDTWLTTYFGCKDTPYHRMTGRSWLRAAVERGYQPGLLVDIIPILQGSQRANKNYAIATLFHSERLDAPWMSIMGKFDPERLELKRLVTSRWILHDDEFKARDPKKLDEMKSWVSKVDEQYLAKYENDITVRPRRALLICSTNEAQYLYDHTGNRRWIKWEVGTIDVAAIARDRLQLFAEAKLSGAWREGLDYDVIEAESEGAEVVDPLRDRLLQLANQPVLLPSGGYAPPLWRGWQTANTIADWLNIPSAHADQAFSMRLGRAVCAIDGKVKRTGRGKKCIRFYFPPPLIDQSAVAAELAEDKY